MTDERNELDKAEQAQAAQYDKAILTVSSALLGLSVAFLKDVAADPPVVICILACAWLSLALSILFTLYSFLTSQNAIRYVRETIDIEETGGEVSNPEPFQTTHILNHSSFWAFALGLFLFCTFAFLNLGGKTLDEKQFSIEGGYQPPKAVHRITADGDQRGYQPSAKKPGGQTNQQSAGQPQPQAKDADRNE